MIVKSILKDLVLPPFGLILILLAITLMVKNRPRSASRFLWFYLGLFYTLSIPFVGTYLLYSLQWYPPVSLEQAADNGGVIVVLSAGSYRDGPEYQETGAPITAGDRTGPFTLERLQYAAYLARQTNMAILTSGGGGPVGPERSIAYLMKRSLEEEFNVPVRWMEEQSRDTVENAQYSRKILNEAGVEKVLLVTHAWHMPRAVLAFEAVGFEVTAAPTRFVFPPDPLFSDFVPSMRALIASYYGLHEWLGLAWYWVMHRK